MPHGAAKAFLVSENSGVMLAPAARRVADYETALPQDPSANEL